MEDMIRKVTIDEERKHILTRHTKTKNGVKVKESDHHTIVTEISVKWNKKKNMKTIEIYNLKDKEGLRKFMEMTNKDSFLSEVFEDKTKNISVKTKQFVKRLGYCFRNSESNKQNAIKKLRCFLIGGESLELKLIMQALKLLNWWTNNCQTCA